MSVTNLQTTKPRARQLTDGQWAIHCERQGVFIVTPGFDAAVKFWYESVVELIGDKTWSK